MIRTTRILTWLGTALLGSLVWARPPLARAAAVGLVATVGIAHGATDDAILERALVRPPGGRRVISGAYALLALGTYVVARRYPASAARALFALAWLHFGAGDAAFARACGSEAHEAGAILVRGAAPLCIRGRDLRSNAAFAAALAAAAYHAGAGAYADALDVLLPATLLYASPAGRESLGFALYFGAWHAPRHLALVLARDPRGGAPFQRLRRFASESAGNVALAALAGALAYVLRGAPDQDGDVFGALILAITVPHQIAVASIERIARG